MTADATFGWSETCAPDPATVHAAIAVHRHTDGTWGFWNEVWTDCGGPFESQDAANAAAKRYAEAL